MSRFTESIVEDAALAWLAGLGSGLLYGPDLAFGMLGAERKDPGFRDVLLEERLLQALERLNWELPAEALRDASRKVLRVEGASLVERNRVLHRMLVDGVTVEYRRPDGSIAGAQARVVDFDKPENNDWLAVNQFTVVEGQHERRPDVVVFVNGLPLAVVELKNAVDEGATVWSAWQQLQTYQAQIPALFAYNVCMVASDGVQARVGVLGAGKEWFKPWRTVDGRGDAPATMSELEVMICGLFDKRRFLDLIRHFVVFEDDGGKITKKMAGYHQFHAVNWAVEQTLRAAVPAEETREGPPLPGLYASERQGGEQGDRRVGVVWHTHPGMVRHTCQRLAEVHGLSPDEMAQVTSANAERFFALSGPLLGAGAAVGLEG